MHGSESSRLCQSNGRSIYYGSVLVSTSCVEHFATLITITYHDVSTSLVAGKTALVFDKLCMQERTHGCTLGVVSLP